MPPVGQDEKIRALSEKETEKLLGRELFRSRTNEIICEYVEKVDFMKKVREYAGMEIDSRVFKSWRYWGTLIFSAVITSLIGVMVAKSL
ncbi:MAG: hypothetical protein V1745_01590 [Patescibacteria group bacterium]